MNTPSPRTRLREALLAIGANVKAPERELATRVGGALRELAAEVLGKSSRIELVTVGGEDHAWGWNLGLRLTDYDVRLPDLLWRADGSPLPLQARKSCPTLTQDGWEALLLFAKLVLTVLESEPVPANALTADAPARHQERRTRPSRSVAREQFCQALAAVAEPVNLPEGELTERLRSALLDFASETPDNQEAALHITVLRAGSPPQRARLGLSQSGCAMAQVILSADACPIPDGVLDDFPDLTQDEWSAVMQVTALTFLAFQADTGPGGHIQGT